MKQKKQLAHFLFQDGAVFIFIIMKIKKAQQLMQAKQCKYFLLSLLV